MTERIRVIYPPRIQAMMCGVHCASQPNKNDSPVTLHYEDGTIETGKYTGDLREAESIFYVVSGIQSQRGK